MLRRVAMVAVLCTAATDAELLGFEGVWKGHMGLRDGKQELAFVPHTAGFGSQLSAVGSSRCATMPQVTTKARTGVLSLECRANKKKGRGKQVPLNASPHAASVSGFPDVVKGAQHKALDSLQDQQHRLSAASQDGVHQTVWKIISGRGRMGREYTMFYHTLLQTVVEIPHGSESIMFRTNGDSTIQRCWGDCNMYERFTFESDASLLEELNQGGGDELSQSSDGAQMGEWKITVDKDGALASYKGGIFQLHLTREGFVVIGEGSRCVTVMKGEDAHVMPVCNVPEEILVGGVHEQVMEDHGCHNKRDEDNCMIDSSAESIVRAYTGQSDIPPEYLCPLSGVVMVEPVVAADGHSYSKQAWEAYCEAGNEVSPVTGEPLAHSIVLPNLALRDVITAHLAEAEESGNCDMNTFEVAQENKALRAEVELLRSRLQTTTRRAARKERGPRSAILRSHREPSPAPM